jgi:hypothetical protein
VAAETLCQLRVEVLQTAARDAAHRDQLHGGGGGRHQLALAAAAARRRRTPTQATLVDRFGVGAGAGGRVYVARAQLVGMLAAPAQAELVNTQVLTAPRLWAPRSL